AAVAAHVVEKKEGFDLSLFARLAIFFGYLRPQVVHTHNPQSLVYAAAPAKAVWARTVHTKHGEAQERGRALFLRRQAARFVDAFVSVSDRTEAFARTHREASGRKLLVIENGVEIPPDRGDPEARSSSREALGIDSAAFVIGTIGRLQAVKNQALLIRASAPLLRRGGHLIIVGEGPERAGLETLIRSLDVGARVHLLGYQDDVGRWLAAFDCFAMSSRTEGLPLVLLEAMARGLPTVCTAVGGIRAAVGSAGELVDAGDEGGLTESLTRVAGDLEAAAVLGAAGRRRVIERYSLATMVARYDAVYRGLAR
ncbi:MAG: glycosyltransferase, partial [Deltaproteobacteria bacterium]|nr:glycosyltransferase [Deltaproteobacteria bacterium]